MDYNSYPFKNKVVDRLLNKSDEIRIKSEKTLHKANVAVDEGRNKKANRLFEKAAKQENRSIKIENRAMKKY